MPLDVTLALETDVGEFTSAVPLDPRSDSAFDAWLARRGVKRAVAAAGVLARKSK